MARAKKDGVHVNLYLDRNIASRLAEYAEIKGQPKTVAIERILGPYLERYFKEHPDDDPLKSNK